MDRLHTSCEPRLYRPKEGAGVFGTNDDVRGWEWITLFFTSMCAAQPFWMGLRRVSNQTMCFSSANTFHWGWSGENGLDCCCDGGGS